jgi:hypothetical protein
MGGTAPICPFCRKQTNQSGISNHIKAKHPDKYMAWLADGCPPYWRYDLQGNLKI